MQRLLYNNLLTWKQSKHRKPLLIQGARQTGKTWLVSEFGKKEYRHFVYLNFEETPDLVQLFAASLTPASIIENLGLYLGHRISYQNTLLFFDEIQAAPKAITALKYFQEQAPEYHIIAAGSLLGVSVGKSSPFPVGKVNFMHLYPMNFMEYLMAAGEESLFKKLREMKKPVQLHEVIHEKLLGHLKIFLFTGGMPEAVGSYVQSKDIQLVRQIQQEILKAYERDFSKYTDRTQAIKTSEVWNSLPHQLSKENKKFKYSDVRKNSRASAYEQTIEWLSKAGLIYKAENISVPKLPLSGYADADKFKIFMHDTGLLGAMLNLPSAIILEPTALFSEYNGAFTENFVAAELISHGHEKLYYWTSGSAAEVDFVITRNGVITPVEVKSGLSRNKKSLQSYADKYKPGMVYRISPRNLEQTANFTNLPLYAVNLLGV
ncbi:MAG: ATP-binding protein [Bacteroidetes bacterium]|nr:ATP-binding protein [Bacteroidota bacterium]